MNCSDGLPSFSVIIPAYNSAGTLARAVDSVLAQNRFVAEIIVVDDASTDQTPEVMSGYSGRVRYLRRESNHGVASARNFGAAQATGDWLAFLDADDYYFPDRLAWHAEWIREDPKLDFLTGDYEYRDSGDAQIGTSMSQHPAGRRLLEKSGGALRVVMQPGDFEEFIAEHFGDTHTLSIPRAVFNELGGYPVGFKVCEDVHLLTRLVARSNRVGVICRAMGAYVVHAASATRRNPVQAQFENVRTLKHLAALARDFPANVRTGVYRRLRRGRLNLAYALLKANRRGHAVKAVVPSLFENPGFSSMRDFLSILRG